MGAADDWKRISVRILGLQRAIEALERNQTHGAMVERAYANPLALGLVADIKTFLTSHGPQIAGAARDALTRGMRHLDGLAPSAHQNSQPGVAGALVAAMLAMESEVAFHLEDPDMRIAPVAERAFLHLQRSLTVDEGLQQSWSAAFNGRNGETSCEKLGAVHLLLHGIYAFKTNAIGERTDLVLGDALAIDSILPRAAVALVLTEWKVAKAVAAVPDMFKAAMAQAKRYGTGHLAGFELHRFRYLVVVTQDIAQTQADIIDGDITYRHINIAFAPSSPSKAKKGMKRQYPTEVNHGR